MRVPGWAQSYHAAGAHISLAGSTSLVKQQVNAAPLLLVDSQRVNTVHPLSRQVSCKGPRSPSWSMPIMPLLQTSSWWLVSLL
jgi:hypothetical protein